ncbi:MAG: indole-3-glycerol phosphate synthase TrpC [Pseudomonadota bacterium]
MAQDILEQICAQRRDDVNRLRHIISEDNLNDQIASLPAPRGFAAALKQKNADQDIGLIAEIKRASPSQGEIRADFDPVSCAMSYARAGASCLSVLTEPHWFKGRDQYIADIKSAVDLPVLRKDFIIDPYQVIESRAIGADCILVIMAALDDAAARDICQTARTYGLDILIEVHDASERDRALTLDFDLLGINNRNLKTMAIDINTTLTLAADIPAGITVVSESGINSYQDICRMMEHDINCFLVGTSLMRQTDLETATRHLLGHS